MTIKLTDKIDGGIRGTVDGAMAYARRVNAFDLVFLLAFFTELYRICQMFGWDFAGLVGQSAHETGDWDADNPNWATLHNPAGLAITNHENKSVVYRSGVDAARAFAVHWWIYLYGPLKPDDYLYPYRTLDGHYDEAATGVNPYSGNKNRYAGSVVTYADLNPNGQWCYYETYPKLGNRYGDRVIAKANAVWGASLPAQVPPVTTPSTPPEDGDPPVTVPSTPEEPIPGEGGPMAVPAYLDYSSLSFPVEVRFVPASHTHQRTGLALVPAYDTWHDTDNKSNGADAESHAAWILAGCPDKNGNPTDTGWHFTVDDEKAIQHIPLNEVAWHAGDGYNGPGNRTSIAIEECVNSDRDAAKTRRNAAELHAFLIKELKLQGGTVNALVQHNRWSGKDCPAEIRRLGLWPSVVSLVSGFLAAGGGSTQPSYAQAHPISKGSQIVNDHQFLAPGGKTFQRDTIPAEWGDGLNNPTGPTIKRGTKISEEQISHYVQGTDGNLYLVLTGVTGVADGSRVPASSLIAA